MSKTKTSQPDEFGHFGKFGGKYVAETLIPIIEEVDSAYKKASKSVRFQRDLDFLLRNYVGRPSPLWPAKELSLFIKDTYKKSIKVYFKRDELNHTGSHKINNCLGQILLAKSMKRTRIIAETGAGQHGVAVATVAALFKLPCVIHMGFKDIERQAPNVARMKMLGAEVRACKKGSASLKDAMNEALRDWTTNINNTYYIIGTVAGPHPYPSMVRDFQAVIGKEVIWQLKEFEGKSSKPSHLIAAVGGGSNAIGLFYPFISDSSVKLYGVEGGGLGIKTGRHAAALSAGSDGVLHGNRSYLLQDKHGQIKEAHCISAGLDYPGVGPEHAWLLETKRATYHSVTDQQALDACFLCNKLEGILPALEPSHALAFLLKKAKEFKNNDIVVLNICGRGDKDLDTLLKNFKTN